MIENDNDFELPFGKDSICPSCYNQQMYKMERDLVGNDNYHKEKIMMKMKECLEYLHNQDFKNGVQ